MKNRFKPQKKTSDVQDRIEAHPDEFAEFQSLERANLGTYIHSQWPHPELETAANRMFNDLDRLFGFEAESQMRKVGVESSHWAGRK